MKRAAESVLWGSYCASSWTWCIGMYLPFILLRLWGWPGFWAFFIPNVLGCALFGFVLNAEKSRAVVLRLGRWAAVFSAVTVAYQCFFAGWAAQHFVVGEGAMMTVASTGVPIVLLALGAACVTRGDRFWLVTGAIALVATLVAAALLGTQLAPVDSREPAVAADRLTWAVPTIAFGFLLCPYLDLTFHRAAQRAPSPRIAFAAFGVLFALVLLTMASLYDWHNGQPLIGPAIIAIWAIQLAFTVAVHLRELALADHNTRIPLHITAALVCGAVLLATPALTFQIGPALEPGEGVYLAFMGAYGLLFPAVVWLAGRGHSMTLVWVIMAIGVPCYLAGAWQFFTYLMPAPVVAALVLGWRSGHLQLARRAARTTL